MHKELAMNRNNLRGVLIGILFALILYPVTPERANAVDSVGAGRSTVTVALTDTLRFEPAVITINAGDTVKWINNARVFHTVTCDSAKAKYPVDVILPAGAEPFDSGYLRPGDRFSHTFTVPGLYRYVCTSHEGVAMIGEVHVK
jgi:plastocyanin